MKISEYYNALKLIIRNYFGFTLREANGFVIIVLLILVLLFIPFLLQLFLTNKSDSLAYELTIIEAEKKIQTTTDSIMESVPVAKEFFNFDPNQTSVKSLNDLGINQKVALRIDNFRKKGGKFRLKKDLLKIYGFDSVLFQNLLPYIQLPDSITYTNKWQKTESVPTPKSFQKLVIDINLADSAQLVQLNGIGATFASRIIKYRTKLGGFYAAEQLKEVYGLDSLKFEQISPNITCNADFHYLNINTITFEELSNHPYIKRNLAKVIISYRDAHGNFKNEDDLKKIKILTSETIAKVAPYIKY